MAEARPKRLCRTRGCFTKTSRKNGLCVSCHHTVNVRPILGRGHYHNVSEDELLARLAAQGGGCAICGKALTIKSLRIDHDHRCCSGVRGTSCGKCIRGLLCNGCNAGLGCLGDSYASLMKASQYLLKWESLTDIPERKVL